MQSIFQSLSCKAIYKAQYDALHPKLFQYLRNIDPLAPQKIFLPGGTVRRSFLKPVQMNHIVDRRTDCHSIDHPIYSPPSR